MRRVGFIVVSLLLPRGGFGEIGVMPVVLAHVPGAQALPSAYTLPLVPMPPPPGRTSPDTALAEPGEPLGDASVLCGERVQVRAIVAGERDRFAIVAVDGESQVVRRGMRVGPARVSRIGAEDVSFSVAGQDVRCSLRGN